VIGLHFLQPVPKVPLVEVVRGLSTSGETFQATMEFVRVLGKTGIEVFEYPGYVTTRVILPFLNEAMHVVMEGVATPERSTPRLRLGYGLPAGPLALATNGARRGLAVDAVPLRGARGPQVPTVPASCARWCGAGQLGVKSGKGFFELRRGRYKRRGAGVTLPVDPGRLRQQFRRLTDATSPRSKRSRGASSPTPRARGRVLAETMTLAQRAREKQAQEIGLEPEERLALAYASAIARCRGSLRSDREGASTRLGSVDARSRSDPESSFSLRFPCRQSVMS